MKKKQFGTILHEAVTVIGITFLLFIALNIIAAFLLPTADKEAHIDNVLNRVYSTESDQGFAALEKYYGKPFANEVKAATTTYAPQPAFSPHPVLHYIVTRTVNKFYQTGVYGLRYFNETSDDKVEALLHSDKRKVFLFGGSTTFSYGLPANQSIAYYLQEKLGSEAIVFNFGANAYDQQRELDLLVYLLRHGIVPDDVIFLDGVNDAMHMAFSNYRAGDKLIYHGFITGRSRSEKPDDNPFVPHQTASWRQKMSKIARLLPLTQLFLKTDIAQKYTPAQVSAELDPFKTKLEIPMAEYVFFHWAEMGDAQLDLKKQEIDTYYQYNLAFLEALSEVYGFNAAVFYQPMGLLNPNNPFVPAMDASVPGYRYMHDIVSHVRAEIKQKKLCMIDLGDSLNALAKTHRAYIDAMHYSPEANQLFADIYAQHLRADSGAACK